MLYKIKQFREEQGLTQGGLAQKSGVSRATVCGLENGSIAVTTTETLIKIASALNHKVSEIFLE